MVQTLVRRFVGLSLVLSILPAIAQVTIELGPDEIASNQTFTITITVQNDRLRQYDQFPDIEGFNKMGTSSSTSTNIVNGQISSSQSLTQNYAATGEGVFTLEPFSIVVNGKSYNSPGKTIKVGPPRQSRYNRSDPFGVYRDPFEEFFGNRNAPQEFIDIKEDAFVAISTDKDEIYAGEGVVATFALYVAESNRAPLEFYDLSTQLQDIMKDIKPQNCWEENFNIEKIQGVPITINGKRYSQYKIFQSAFYPLNEQDISFPSVGLKMIKYKVAKQRSFFGQDRQQDFKTFYTKAKTIDVKPLPPHPLKDLVSVGDFSLSEEIDQKELSTGSSFTYSFRIGGEGNISSINEPKPKQDENIEFYSPNVNQQINRSGNAVTGIKAFHYYGIPNEPGTYNLEDYFSWIFFNTKKEAYDTLKSSVVLTVTGESKKNAAILSTDLGGIYDKIQFTDNKLTVTGKLPLRFYLINLSIIFTAGLSIYLLIKRYG